MLQDDKAVKCKEENYKNARDCIMKIYRREGIKGFFRGSRCLWITNNGQAFTLIFMGYLQERF